MSNQIIMYVDGSGSKRENINPSNQDAPKEFSIG